MKQLPINYPFEATHVSRCGTMSRYGAPTRITQSTVTMMSSTVTFNLHSNKSETQDRACSVTGHPTMTYYRSCYSSRPGLH